MKRVNYFTLAKQLALLIVAWLATSLAAAVTPQSGLWGIDAENTGQPGRGFTIDIEYSVLVLTLYAYNADGSPQWYLAAGPLTDTGFTGSLDEYRGGTALGMPYAPAARIGSAGNVVLVFKDSTHGTITLPGEAAKPISRLVFASSPPPSTDPRTLSLQVAGFWQIYTSDQQTLLGSYLLDASTITHGVDGWYVTGENINNRSSLQFVDAGYNTSTSLYYILDLTAETGFIYEFDFPSVTRPVTGCRYRYPLGSTNKGVCLAVVAF